jgi:Ca-activated chloride channel family protein
VKYLIQKIIVWILLIFLFAGRSVFPQIPLKKRPEPPLTRILFVFDCSKSMSGKWNSDKKINIARRFLASTVDSLQNVRHVQMALRVFGHQSPVPPQDCSDSRLEVPFGPNNAGAIKHILSYLIPKGTTPIARSLALAAKDFTPCDNCRNVIVLITDGIEACDGDPCAVSQKLQKKGIILRPFVIGIGEDPEFRKTYHCVGRFYDAANEKEFDNVLKVVIREALDRTTAQVNLLDSYGNPTETNVNMTFYDMMSGKVMNNFYQTINNRGNPDTIYLDPLVTYRLVVHTIPPVTVDSIHVFPRKHTIIPVDAPQGSLMVTSSNAYRDHSVVVRRHNGKEIINVQKLNEKEKYLTGKYDIEVLVLPRMKVTVEVKQSTTTTVDIPQPGLINVFYPKEGYGSLYRINGNEQEWVINLKDNVTRQALDLLPGNYIIVYRPRYSKSIEYTREKKFKLESGQSLTIRFF